jgi:hypothetical protein
MSFAHRDVSMRSADQVTVCGQAQAESLLCAR